jgi:membrane-bound lytic murein transglycosylase D
MSDRFRFFAPPLMLVAGYFVGRDLGPITITRGLPAAASVPAAVAPPAPAPRADRGRASAESIELRELREAEAALFPEVGSKDFDLSDPEAWDRAAETANGGIPMGDGVIVAPKSVETIFEGLKQPAMKVPRNHRIARYVEYFTSSEKGRKLFSTWLRRSGKYRGVMEAALGERNLPLDLMAVACIESGYWPTARSSAGAVGLWQFMPSTARAYGLVVDRSVDERRNIWRSTDAASQHLADLHERFQSWDLALAAYNMGYKQLLRRLENAGVHDFWSLADVADGMPRETRLYVPKVMAVALVLANLSHFGFDDVELMGPLAASEIRVPPGVRLSLVARAAGTSLRHIRELNEEFRGDMVPDRGGPTTLHIPPKGLARARTMLPKLMKSAEGDTLDKDVAPDFDWGTDDLATAKKAKGKDKDDAPTTAAGRARRNREIAGSKRDDDASGDDGERDRDPGAEPEGSPTTKGSSTGPLAPPAAPSEPAEASAKPSSDGAFGAFPTTLQVHEVKRGDNLWKLSERYGVSRRTIARDNHLKHPDTLVLGKVLVVNVPKKSGAPSTEQISEAVLAPGSSLAPPGDAGARLDATELSAPARGAAHTKARKRDTSGVACGRPWTNRRSTTARTTRPTRSCCWIARTRSSS